MPPMQMMPQALLSHNSGSRCWIRWSSLTIVYPDQTVYKIKDEALYIFIYHILLKRHGNQKHALKLR